MQQLEELIAACEDEHERLRQMKKLQVLMMKIDARRGITSNISSQEVYYQKVVEKISVKKKR